MVCCVSGYLLSTPWCFETASQRHTINSHASSSSLMARILSPFVICPPLPPAGAHSMGRAGNRNPPHKRHTLLAKCHKYKTNRLCSCQRRESVGNSSPSNLLEIYSCLSLRRAAVRRCWKVHPVGDAHITAAFSDFWCINPFLARHPKHVIAIPGRYCPPIPRNSPTFS